MTCKIDHDHPDASIPRDLCRVCNPVAPGQAVKAASALPPAPAKDPRIPKGMSEEDGKAMLERRAAEKKAKAKKRVEAMLKEKADADAVKLDEINLKRKDKGLEPLVSLDQADESIAKQQEGPAATKESNVSKKAKAKSSKKAKAAKKVDGNGVREGSKAELIAKMLKRPSGCTTKEVLKATGWPTVSMPAQAAMAGIKLRKEKTDKGLRYYAQ